MVIETFQMMLGETNSTVEIDRYYLFHDDSLLFKRRYIRCNEMLLTTILGVVHLCDRYAYF